MVNASWGISTWIWRSRGSPGGLRFVAGKEVPCRNALLVEPTGTSAISEQKFNQRRGYGLRRNLSANDIHCSPLSLFDLTLNRGSISKRAARQLLVQPHRPFNRQEGKLVWILPGHISLLLIHVNLTADFP